MAVVRGAAKFNVSLVGDKELERQFARIGKMPKKYLTKAAREGMADLLAQAKTDAPQGKTGTLKKSVKTIMETKNKRNKGVYRLYYSPKYTDHFRVETTGKYGGETPYGYYPNSVEFGYMGKYGHVKPKTMYWADKAMRKHTQTSLQKVIDSLYDSINQLTK